MPIDPSIALSVKAPQFESPVNALSQMLQVQGAQQQNQLGQAKLDEYQRGVGRQNLVYQTMQKLGAGATDDDRVNALKSLGEFESADKVQAGQLARTKTDAEAKKSIAAALKDNAQVLNIKLQHHRDQLGPINDPQGAAAWVTAMYQDKDMAPIVQASGRSLDQTIASIPADPKQFAQWKMQSSLGADKLVQFTTPDANTVAKNTTSAANNAATNATLRANNAATVGATLNGQKLVDARARDALEEGKTQVVQSDAGPVLVNKRTGAGTAVLGPDGQPLGKILKPIPASVNTAMIANTQTLAQLDRTIALLEGKNKDGQTGDKEATGLKGYLPQQMLNAVDPKGIDARAGVADIGSLKLHDRSGAAVTASESPRLMPFIPTATDSNETALKKLKRLRLEAANESDALGETYGKDAGYKPNPVVARASKSTGGVPDDIAALLQKHGGK